MFTQNDMRTLLKALPFVPFRLWLDNGEHLDVFRANQVMPLRHYAIVGLLDPNDLEEASDRHTTVGYMYITRYEHLPENGLTGQ